MSQKKQILLLYPAKYDNAQERFELPNFSCPRCSGRGYTFTYMRNEQVQEECVRCGGSGQLKALVMVEWKGYKELRT
jgi:DnaJ-class molecular chaperone